MEQKPIISKSISAGSRVYYVDLYHDSKQQPYLSISEIPTHRAPKMKKRQRIFIHAENIEKFSKAFSEVADLLKNGIE